jgi:hypothetical protein
MILGMLRMKINPGNDQAHFVRVKMPAICSMIWAVVQLNEYSFMKIDPTDE